MTEVEAFVGGLCAESSRSEARSINVIANTAPICGHGDTLHYQKGPRIRAWGHFAMAKRHPCMGMETRSSGKKASIYRHGDNLHWQNGLHMWA